MNLFPLRLTPFEEYMLLDDRPAYPMHVWCRLRLRGRLDRQALETAVAEPLEQHPLFNTILAPNSLRRPAWIQAAAQPTASDQLQWCSADVTQETFPLPAIDLTKEPGCRLFVNQQADTTNLLIQIHHSSADGLGLCSFVSDLLERYHAIVASSQAEVRHLTRDLARLAERGKFGLSARGGLSQGPRLLLGAPNSVRFYLHRAAALKSTPLSPGEVGDSYLPGWLEHSLTVEQTAALRQRVKLQGATLNDRLVCDLLLTLSRWQAERPDHEPKHWLRISVPVNLRLPADAGLPAANVVSMIFIDRRGDLLAKPPELLRSVQQQMNRIKRHRLGLIFPLVAGALRSIGRLHSMTAAEHCRATAVLSNLGEPFASSSLPRDATGRLLAGDLVLEHFAAFAPLRPLTQVAVLVSTYAGQLTLAMHYDRQTFTTAEATDLQQRFLGQILNLNAR